MDKSLVTVVLAETGAEWTMSVMQDEEDLHGLTEARLNAAICLVRDDGVPLVGCWGPARNYIHGNAQVTVVFPVGTRVEAAYQESGKRPTTSNN